MAYQLINKPTKKEAWALAGANAKIVKNMVWKLQPLEGKEGSLNNDDYKNVQVWSGDYLITSSSTGTAFKHGIKNYSRNVTVKANKIKEVKHDN